MFSYQQRTSLCVQVCRKYKTDAYQNDTNMFTYLHLCIKCWDIIFVCGKALLSRDFLGEYFSYTPTYLCIVYYVYAYNIYIYIVF